MKFFSYISKAAFFISAAFALLFFAINLFEALKPLDALKDYPFGTEGGYGYHSAEEYHVSAMTDAWLLGLNLIVGILCYVLKRPEIGAAIMLATVCFYWRLGLTYGMK